eukprot:1159280-Pelagomonas_calceolata.AAC.5
MEHALLHRNLPPVLGAVDLLKLAAHEVVHVPLLIRRVLPAVRGQRLIICRCFTFLFCLPFWRLLLPACTAGPCLTCAFPTPSIIVSGPIMLRNPAAPEGSGAARGCGISAHSLTALAHLAGGPEALPAALPVAYVRWRAHPGALGSRPQEHPVSNRVTLLLVAAVAAAVAVQTSWLAGGHTALLARRRAARPQAAAALLAAVAAAVAASAS